MNLKELRAANIARNSIWDPDGKLDLDFFLNELGGELGEAMNVLKKLDREVRGLRGSKDNYSHLAEELADIGIILDLCAMKAGFDALMSVGTFGMSRASESAWGVQLFKGVGPCIYEPISDNFDVAFDYVRSAAEAHGVDLMDMIPKKFNLTSTKYNLPIFIGVPK